MVEYTHEEIREFIDIEGFEYALTSYISADNIVDEELAEMVREFADLHSTIEDALWDGEDEELKDTVESEGLDYALTDYVDADSLVNADLADGVGDYLTVRRKIKEALSL